MSLLDFVLNFNILIDGVVPDWTFPYIDEGPTVDYSLNDGGGGIYNNAAAIDEETSDFSVVFWYEDDNKQLTLVPSTVPELLPDWLNTPFEHNLVAVMHTFEIGSYTIVNPIVEVHNSGGGKIVRVTRYGGAPTYYPWIYDGTKFAKLDQNGIPAGDFDEVVNAIRTWFLQNNLGFSQFSDTSMTGSDYEGSMVLPLSYRLEV